MLHLKFTIGQDVYEADADTILDALKQIKPTRYLGFGSVTVTEDGKTHEVPIKLVPVKLQRIFEKDYEMELFAKRISVLL